MRRDTVTGELPGIPPATVQARAVRTTLQARREAAGYVGPRDCESCRCCAHRLQSAYLRDSCGLHGWPVHLGGICNDFEAMP